MSVDTLDEHSKIVDRREAGFIGLAFVFLVLLAGSLSLSMAARMGSWAYAGGSWVHWTVLPVWLLAYLLLRRGLRLSNPTRDPLLLPIPMLFMGWGMLTVWRLDPAFGIRQLGWFILAASCLYGLLAYGKDLSWIRRYRYLWITIGLLLMILTLFFGSHPGGGSPRLWLGCCGFYFQPSEALRFLLVAFLAAYLADRLAFEEFTHTGWKIKSWLPLILIWSLSFSLLIAQRDLGTGMLFMGLLTILLYLVIQRWQVLAIAAALGLAGGWLGSYLFDVVSLRIEAWLNPLADPLGGSYQIIQSLITVASGGVFGRGMGLGSPGFVPAIHTDFIFTAIIEEHGALAGLVIIGLWGIWISRAIIGVMRQRDSFFALISAGLTFSLGLQAVLIIGGNLRVFPLVGITLPFISYGGSSLLISVLSTGIILLLPGQGSLATRFRIPLRYLHMGMLITLGITSGFLGWWTIVRAPAITSRGDDPRSAVDSRYSLRGSIYDRDLHVLAETIGSPGAYERVYREPAAAAIVGYDQFPYGRAGLEGSLDDYLRGDAGEDEWYTFWSYLSRGTSPPGMDVRLTLDIELQRVAAGLLSDQRGAIVLIDADTGDLLVAASSPSYDPNLLESTWSELVGDFRAPLLNRPFQGSYQPGTTLLPISLAWALDQFLITLDMPVEDLNEPVSVNGAFLGCAQTPGRIGHPDLTDALTFGCPGPFQALNLKLGRPAYEEMVMRFQLTQQPGSKYLESAGVPINQLPEESLALAAVGQSTLTLSPLQLARAFAPILNDGSMPIIRWVDATRSQGGEWERFGESFPSSEIFDPDTAAEIRSILTAGEYVSYPAQAISGERLGWFMGGVRSLGGNFAVVIVLEGGEPDMAAALGHTLLDSVLAAVLP